MLNLNKTSELYSSIEKIIHDYELHMNITINGDNSYVINMTVYNIIEDCPTHSCKDTIAYYTYNKSTSILVSYSINIINEYSELLDIFNNYILLGIDWINNK